MAYFALLWKARTIEKYRHIYEQEKMNSIMLSNSESHKQSLLQKFRHYRYDTRKRVGNLFRKCCPEGSKMGNLIMYLKTDQTFPNFAMKSVIGFVGGIVLTYLCFMFFVFQLAISLVHATIMSSIIGVLLTLGLAFSYRVRCLVFLLIPQFFSKVGRYTLTCYALVLILTGPATNTLRNSEVLSESMACGQEQVKISVKQITDSIKKPFNSMKDTIKMMIERVKHVATKLKETLLMIHRLVMSIVRVFQSAFSWLSSIVGICNKKVGTPYVRCKRALGDGVLDCQAKLGPYFAWLCNVIYVAEAACWTVKPLDLICILVEFVSGTIVATVKRKLNTFSNHIKTMLYVSVRVHHSYTFSSNSSRSASQVAAGIVTEIRHRAEPLLTWLSWSSCVTSLFLCLIIFRAKYYQHMYETRSRYDNRYVTKELRNLDLKRVREDRETVLPLNRRERAKYVTTTSFRLVASEKLYLTRSVVFMGITTFKLLVHMVADYSLYWVLVTIRYHGRFQTPQLPGVPDAGIQVSGKGPVAGMVRSLVDSLSVPLTTPVPSPASCLPDPYPPDFQRYTQIGVLIFLLWFFALFEPYGLRLRHVIMGHYRPERAKARAVWLYNHILRTRGGFLKLARRKLHRDYKYQSEERFTFRQWLDANIPCMWLRYLLRTMPKGAHCLLCNTTEHPNDPDTQLIHCETANCPGIYCASCFSDIGQLCTICLTPRDYGDISDVSLEKGSSDESSSEEERSDSDGPPGEERTMAKNKQDKEQVRKKDNYKFNIRPTKKTKNKGFIQRYNKKSENINQEPQQAVDPTNQYPNDEIGNSNSNKIPLGDIQSSKIATSRGSIRRHSNKNDNFNQKPQQANVPNRNEKENSYQDHIALKQRKGQAQLHAVKRKRKLTRLRNFYKVSKDKLKSCILTKFQKGKTKTRTFKIFKQSKRRRRKKSSSNLNMRISTHKKGSSDDSSENRGTLNRNQDSFFFKPKTTVKNIYNASTSRIPNDDNNNNNNAGPSASSKKCKATENDIVEESNILHWITEQYREDIGTTVVDNEQRDLDTENAKSALFNMYKKRKNVGYTVRFQRPNKPPKLFSWDLAALLPICTCPDTKCFCIGLDTQPYVTIKRKHIPLGVWGGHRILGKFFKCCRRIHYDPPAETFEPHFIKTLKKEMKIYDKEGNTKSHGPELCLSRCPHYYKNVGQRLAQMKNGDFDAMTKYKKKYLKQLGMSSPAPEPKMGMIPKADATHNIFYKSELNQLHNKVIHDLSFTLSKTFKKSNSHHNQRNNIKLKIKPEDIPSTSKHCNVQHSRSLSHGYILNQTDSALAQKPKSSFLYPASKSRQRMKMSKIYINRSNFKSQGDSLMKIETIKQDSVRVIQDLLASDKISREDIKFMKKSIAVFNVFLEYMKKRNKKLADNVNKKIISSKKSNDNNKISTKELKNSKLNVKKIFFKKRSEIFYDPDERKKNCNDNQERKENYITENIIKHDIAKKKDQENICKECSEKCSLSDKCRNISNNNQSCKETYDMVKHNMPKKKGLDNMCEKLSEKCNVLDNVKKTSNNKQKCKGKNVTQETGKHNIAKKKVLDNLCEKRSEKCSVLDKLKRNGDCYLKCKRKNITEDRVKHNVTKKKDLDCETVMKSKHNLDMELTHIVVDNNVKGKRYGNRKDVKIDIPAEPLQRSTTEVNYNDASSFTASNSYDFDYSTVSISHSEHSTEFFSLINNNLKFDKKLEKDSISGSSYYCDWWSPMSNCDSCVLNVGHYVE